MHRLKQSQAGIKQKQKKSVSSPKQPVKSTSQFLKLPKAEHDKLATLGLEKNKTVLLLIEGLKQWQGKPIMRKRLIQNHPRRNNKAGGVPYGLGKTYQYAWRSIKEYDPDLMMRLCKKTKRSKCTIRQHIYKLRKLGLIQHNQYITPHDPIFYKVQIARKRVKARLNFQHQYLKQSFETSLKVRDKIHIHVPTDEWRKNLFEKTITRSGPLWIQTIEPQTIKDSLFYFSYRREKQKTLIGKPISRGGIMYSKDTTPEEFEKMNKEADQAYIETQARIKQMRPYPMQRKPSALEQVRLDIESKDSSSSMTSEQRQRLKALIGKQRTRKDNHRRELSQKVMRGIIKEKEGIY